MNIFLQTFLTVLVLAPFVFVPWMVFRGILPHQKDSTRIASLYAVLLAVFVWRMDISTVAAAFTQGLWVFLELWLAIFFGFMFQQTYRQSKACAAIRGIYSWVSEDPRIQAILAGFFMGSAIESILGVAGHAPGFALIMLAGLGFPPPCAIIMGMTGPLAASAFCSMGTPIWYGVAQGMSDPAFAGHLEAAGFTQEGYLRLVTAQTAVLHGSVVIFLPLLMMGSLRLFGKDRSWKSVFSIAPFAIFCGLAFSVPYVFTAIFLGPEFPSLIGAVVGAAIAVTAAKIGFLVPREKFEFPDQEEWQINWAPTKGSKFKPEPQPSFPGWVASVPLLLLATLLIISRTPSVAKFLNSITFTWPEVFGSSINIVSRPAYLPITWIVIFCMVFATFLFGLSTKQARAFWWPSIIPSASVWLKVMFLLPVAFIFIHSGTNAWGWPSMTRVVADFFAQVPGREYWISFFVPIMGGLSTPLTASNTYGTLICTPFIFNLEQTLGSPPGMLVALLVAGAGTGCLVSARYLTSSVTFLAMLAWEGPIMHKNSRPAIIYVLLLGIAGFCFIHFFDLTAFLLQYVPIP